VLLAAGRAHEAEGALRQALSLKPDDAGLQSALNATLALPRAQPGPGVQTSVDTLIAPRKPSA
jgi:cytochrome c-type biogenesis protein CcmH/NrfG